MADTRRRLRSGTVVLGGMGLLAAALTACSSDPDKRCVDRGSYQQAKGYKVVSDKNCKSGSGTGVWYYGGKKHNGWVDGGSLSKPRKGGGGSGGGHGGGVDRGGFGGGKGSGGG
ncbi:hypothetical protein [Streptomyces galbus]|jgi:hypothetical protein|uniref:Lipoprotein n=1 Tax=Streptomyces galbus TaxID=33898 RepID=A0A4U5W5Z1_STRGB|nr:hypothetical protein [Streptomyces galbus]NKQ27000.1 hypothetical protein [Streptomyces galbus]TKS96679.1 hypothetical protein E4U92_34445 [Streptomyces galbus]GHD48689.1 hypothetical protein GCM10010335_57700 [Streptomyces galbus]